MRVYTCTPVRFKGDYTFFARDSGLFSVGLGTMGVDSRPIMPGPEMPDDDPRLIRTDYGNLESANWWRSLALDGLILYSWAAPKYNAIARAVRAAGIPFLVNMDSSGLVSPLANYGDWLREVPVQCLYRRPGVVGKALELAKSLVELMVHRGAKGRLEHYDAATVVATVTPYALRWIPNEAIRLGRPDLASKFIYLPHPQLEIFSYGGVAKEPLVITVGRWRKEDWAPKNPKLLLKTLREFLIARPHWKGMIVGAGAPDLNRLLGIDISAIADRLELVDYVKPERLPDFYQRARVGLWTSRWEGQQATGAQALCCGCSIVSAMAALKSCFRHYVSRESGRISPRSTPQALCDELVLEADAWEAGERDPGRISRIWCQEFHATEVAKRALAALGLPKG